MLPATIRAGRAENRRAEDEEQQPLLGQPQSQYRGFPNQYFAAIIANIIGISWGTSIGWSSPAIAKMTNHPVDSPLDFLPSPAQLSWIGSILTLGGFVGPILFAPLPGLIGRKCSLLLSSLFFILSFLILIVTNDITSIYIARFLQGCGSGIVIVILPIFIGEISSPNCRGILSSFIQIGFVIGVLYAYSIGPYVTYIKFQWLCLMIPVAFVLMFMCVLDTPHYYLSRGNHDMALLSMIYYRDHCSQDVLDELDAIKASLQGSLSKETSFCDLFRGKANITAVTIVLGLISFQNFSGIDAVLFYSETILYNAGSSLNSSSATIVNGIAMLVASLASTAFVDYSGRKKLLLISAAGMAASLWIMGIYFFLDSHELTTGLGLVPVISLVVFILFYCVGFGPLPFTLLGEMFAPEIKSMASCFAVSACWISDFAVTKSFLPLESIVGSYGNFWIFSTFCVLAFIFTKAYVFETKGLTLHEIQERLAQNSPALNGITANPPAENACDDATRSINAGV